MYLGCKVRAGYGNNQLGCVSLCSCGAEVVSGGVVIQVILRDPVQFCPGKIVVHSVGVDQLSVFALKFNIEEIFRLVISKEGGPIRVSSKHEIRQNSCRTRNSSD